MTLCTERIRTLEQVRAFLGGSEPVQAASLQRQRRSTNPAVVRRWLGVHVGIPIVAAVAKAFGMTLIGFAKPAGFNIYTGRHRVG